MVRLLALLVLAAATANAQLFTQWRENGIVADFPMLSPEPQPLNLVVGNTYRLAFSNLPSVGSNPFQQWCNFLLKVDTLTKTQEINLDLQFFNFGGSSPTYTTSLRFRPSDWINNDNSPIRTGLSEMVLTWTDLKSGEVEFTPRGGDLSVLELDIQFKRNEFYQVVLIPEPSSLSLLLAGGAVLMAGRRRKV